MWPKTLLCVSACKSQVMTSWEKEYDNVENANVRVLADNSFTELKKNLNLTKFKIDQ